MAGDDWKHRGACYGATELMYPADGGGNVDSTRAKEVCARCPVRLRCLAVALVDYEEIGVWGGTSPRERELIRKRLGIRRKPRASTPTGTLAPCGTEAAYRRHLRRGETPCQDCKTANRIACAISKDRVGWRRVTARHTEQQRQRRRSA